MYAQSAYEWKIEHVVNYLDESMTPNPIRTRIRFRIKSIFARANELGLCNYSKFFCTLDLNVIIVSSKGE